MSEHKSRVIPARPIRLAVSVASLGFTGWLALILTLPPINPQAIESWVLALVLVLIWGVILSFVWRSAMPFRGALFVAAVLLALFVVASVPSWLLWFGNDRLYQSLLPVQERSRDDFVRMFSATNTSDRQLPTVILPAVDKDLSIAQAMGRLGSYGAQFTFNPEVFSAIAVPSQSGSRLVRVSPLEYANDLVAFNLAHQGTAGYIEVDQASGEARLVEVPGGLKYIPSGFWDMGLWRHLRGRYPTAIFGDWAFEIDDAGQPWWVVPVVHHTIGLFGGADVVAVVLVNPVDGECLWFDRGQEPAWIDRVYPSQMVLEQARDHFSLKNGWINLVFGPMLEVFQPSDGYTYFTAVEGGRASTYLFSGVTSPNENDQTSVGAIVVNLKTKEAAFFRFEGITEMRAMEIAVNDERVRAQSLDASWPILVAIDAAPTYYLILRNAFQRQRFVLMDASDGAPVAMADTFEGALSQYASAQGFTTTSGALTAVTGTVSRVRTSTGGTLAFLLQGEPEVVYLVSEQLNVGSRFLQPGDRLTLKYREAPTRERIVTELVNLSLR